MTGNVGDSITASCNATLRMDVTGATIEFDYRLTSNIIDAVAGTVQTDKANISSSAVIPGGEYTCTVTVAALGICGGGWSEAACPTKISDPVIMPVERE